MSTCCNSDNPCRRCLDGPDVDERLRDAPDHVVIQLHPMCLWCDEEPAVESGLCITHREIQDREREWSA
jgi:hypothetical protein